MQASSRRVGPTYDHLRLVMQPFRGHVAWDLMRIRLDGPRRTGSFIERGSVPMTADALAGLTARGMLMLVLASMEAPAEQPAPPLGDMGEQQTLDLDFSE